MKETSLAASPQEIRIAPAGFSWGLIGIAVNFAGGELWLGPGPALFIAGALTVALSWWCIALFVWFSARWVAPHGATVDEWARPSAELRGERGRARMRRQMARFVSEFFVV